MWGISKKTVVQDAELTWSKTHNMLELTGQNIKGSERKVTLQWPSSTVGWETLVADHKFMHLRDRRCSKTAQGSIFLRVLEYDHTEDSTGSQTHWGISCPKDIKLKESCQRIVVPSTSLRHI